MSKKQAIKDYKKSFLFQVFTENSVSVKGFYTPDKFLSGDLFDIFLFDPDEMIIALRPTEDFYAHHEVVDPYKHMPSPIDICDLQMDEKTLASYTIRISNINAYDSGIKEGDCILERSKDVTYGDFIDDHPRGIVMV